MAPAMHNACRNGVDCSRSDCHFNHPPGRRADSQSHGASSSNTSASSSCASSSGTSNRTSISRSNAPPGIVANVLNSQLHSSVTQKRACRDGVECSRRNCYFAHPSGRLVAAVNAPSVAVTASSQVPWCTFGSRCRAIHCRFRHAGSRVQSACRKAEHALDSAGSSSGSAKLHPSLDALRQLTVPALRKHRKLLAQRTTELESMEPEMQAVDSSASDDEPDSGSVSSAGSSASIITSPSASSRSAAVVPDDTEFSDDMDAEADAVAGAARGMLDDKITEMTLQQSEFEGAIAAMFDKLTSEERANPSPSKIDSMRAAINREIKRLQAALPIYALRSSLSDAVQRNHVTIVVAATGSGKSTQLVQYLAEQEWTRRGGTSVIITEPRKIAAQTVAARVAEEWGCRLGQEIGVASGGHVQCSPATRVRFTTDSALLHECMEDPCLSKYSVIVMDEVHERRCTTDLLLGSVRVALRRNQNLKLVVMSATLNAQLFLDYFQPELQTRLVEVAGRTFPIKIVHEPATVEDYVSAAVRRSLQIHQSGAPGDVLIFLSGLDEIEAALKQLRKSPAAVERAAVSASSSHSSGASSAPALQLLPLHGKCSEDEVRAVFAPSVAGCRKIIVSSNLAETGVTITGLRFVIDSGMVKEVRYDHVKKIQSLQLGTITQSSARQRAGRAGRTAPGTCYRLYTADEFDAMDVSPRAEILTLQPSAAVLQLKHLGVRDLARFDWLERPSLDALKTAVTSLQLLQALDDSEQLTPLGKSMAGLPTSPQASAAILASVERGCAPAMVLLVALVGVSGLLWWRGKTPQEKLLSAQSRATFACPSGDHVTLLRVYSEWLQAGEHVKWCMDHFVNGKALGMARESAKEIVRAMVSAKLWPSAGSQDFLSKTDALRQALRDKDTILEQCLTIGFFENLLMSLGRVAAGFSIVTSKLSARVGMTSVWQADPAAAGPSFALYDQLLNVNGRNLISLVTRIETSWLDDVSPKWRSLFNVDQLALDVPVMQTVTNQGAAVLSALSGIRGRGLRELEETIGNGCSVEISFEDSELCLWSKQREAAHALQTVQRRISDVRARLHTEVFEETIAGSCRVLIGPGALVHTLLVGAEHTSVMLRKLPATMREADVRKLVQPFGQAVSVFLHAADATPGANSSAWAKVRFAAQSEAASCVRKLNLSIQAGTSIIVSPLSNSSFAPSANSQDSRVKLVWNLTASLCEGKIFFRDDAMLKAAVPRLAALLPAGVEISTTPIALATDVTCVIRWPIVPHKGCAIVSFASDSDRAVAIAAMQGSALCGQALVLQIASTPARPSSHRQVSRALSDVFVKHVAPAVGNADLVAHFRRCSGFVRVFAMRDSKAVLDVPTTQAYLRAVLSPLHSLYPDRIRVSTKGGIAEAFVEFAVAADGAACVQMMENNAGLCVGLERPRAAQWEHRSTHHASKIRKPAVPDVVKHVKLSKLPAAWDEVDVLRALDGVVGVEHAVVFRHKLEANHPLMTLSSEDQQDQLIVLQSLFTVDPRVSPPEIQIQPPSTDGRCCAVASFENATDVAVMMASIPDFPRPIVFGCIARLTALVSHCVFIHKEQSRAIPRTIERLRTEIEAMRGVRIKQVDTAGAGVKLFLNGEDSRLIAVASRALSLSLRGHVVDCRDGRLDCLTSPTGVQFLKRLQSRCGVYVLWNKREAFLRISGEPEDIAKAVTQMQRFTSEHVQRSIAFPPAIARTVLLRYQALNTMAAKHGAAAEIGKRASVLIRGNSAAVQGTADEVQPWLAEIAARSRVASKDAALCPVCTCEIEGAYQLQACGHSYCRECAVKTVEMAPSEMDLRRYGLRCVVPECGQEYLVRDVCNLAGGSDLMAGLVRASFNMHLRQQGKQLARCTGIDCDNVFRTAAAANDGALPVVCDACGQSSCLRCDVPYHLGLSCAEFKAKQNAASSLDHLKSNLGNLPFRICPNLACAVPQEKIEGCNAVVCPLCATPFCWLCLASSAKNTDPHKHFGIAGTKCYGKLFEGVYHN